MEQSRSLCLNVIKQLNSFNSANTCIYFLNIKRTGKQVINIRLGMANYFQHMGNTMLKIVILKIAYIFQATEF
jgi:hypothetical protein